MLKAFFTALLDVVAGWLKSLLATNRDERMGAIKENNALQKQVIENVEKKNNINNRVDNASPADIDRMSADLDGADQ